MKVLYYKTNHKLDGCAGELYRVNAFTAKIGNTKVSFPDTLSGYAFIMPGDTLTICVLTDCKKEDAFVWMRSIQIAVTEPPFNVDYDSEITVDAVLNGRSEVFPVSSALVTKDAAKYIKPLPDGKTIREVFEKSFSVFFPLEKELNHSFIFSTSESRLIPRSRDYHEYDLQVKGLLNWVAQYGGLVPERPEFSCEYILYPTTSEDWYVCACLLQRGFLNRAEGITIYRICNEAKKLCPFDPFVRNFVPLTNIKFNYVPLEETTAISNAVNSVKNLPTGSLVGVGLSVACFFALMFLLVKLGVVQKVLSKLSFLPLPNKLKEFFSNLKFSDNLFHRFNKETTVLVDGEHRSAIIFSKLFSSLGSLNLGSASYEILDYDVEDTCNFKLANLGKFVVIELINENFETKVIAESSLGKKFVFSTRSEWKVVNVK